MWRDLEQCVIAQYRHSCRGQDSGLRSTRPRPPARRPASVFEMINYIPILTTIFSAFFLSRIVPHYLVKSHVGKSRPTYLLWWSLGVLTFGLGTLTESINAIAGWSEWNAKIWYIVGALLPGIGGTATRFGYVEVLYITELIGLVFIYVGYHMMRKDHSASVYAPQQAGGAA